MDWQIPKPPLPRCTKQILARRESVRFYCIETKIFIKIEKMNNDVTEGKLVIPKDSVDPPERNCMTED